MGEFMSIGRVGSAVVTATALAALMPVAPAAAAVPQRIDAVLPAVENPCDRIQATSEVWADILWPLPPVSGLEAATMYTVVMTAPRHGGRSFFAEVVDTNTQAEQLSDRYYYKVVRGKVKDRSRPIPAYASTPEGERWEARLNSRNPAGVTVSSYRTGGGLYVDSCYFEPSS